MPLALRSRLLLPSAAIGDPATEIERRAVASSNWTVRLSTSRTSVVEVARSQEAFDYDGVLVPERSGWPDVYAQSAWALAHTQRLETVAAHRIGRQSPTTTARSAQTLDLLSEGRFVHHFLTGHNDRDQRRDGDFLAKTDRYRRAEEFLEVYTRTLSATEPFDFDGDFYRVRDAFSGVGNHAQPTHEISWAGSSPPALGIAARYADTFSLPATSLADTLEVTGEVSKLAGAHGRRLRFWYNSNQILAESDERAREIALGTVRHIEEHPEILRLDIDQPESVSRKKIYGHALDSDWVDDVLFLGLARLTGVESVPAFVGSPETVAGAILRLYENGIEIIGIDPAAFTQQELELKQELVRLLRAGAARIDDLAERNG